MQQYNANNDKNSGSIDKSGLTAIDVPGTDDALVIDAAHVIDVGSGDKQLIYLGPKQDGIDIIVTERTVTGRSERGQELLAAHVNDDADTDVDARDASHADGDSIVTAGDDAEIVTDGGQDKVEPGDEAYYKGSRWDVVEVRDSTVSLINPDGGLPVEAVVGLDRFNEPGSNGVHSVVTSNGGDE